MVTARVNLSSPPSNCTKKAIPAHEDGSSGDLSEIQSHTCSETMTIQHNTLKKLSSSNILLQYISQHCVKKNNVTGILLY